MMMSFIRPWRSLFCILALIVLFAASPGLLEAQEPAATTETAELEALLETLEDPESRERFLEQLRSLVEVHRATAQDAPAEDDIGTRMLAELSGGVADFSQVLMNALQALLQLPGALAEAIGDLRDPAAQQRVLEILLKLALVFGAGFLAESLTRRALDRPRRTLDDRAGDTFVLRAVYLLLRTLLDIIPIAVFAAVAYGILPLTEPREVTRLVALAVINANVLVRVVTALGRMVLAPTASGLRLIPANDDTAAYTYVWLRRFTVTAVYGFFFLDAFLLLGLAPSAHLLLINLLGLVLAGMLVVLILQVRRAVAEWLRGRPETGGRLAQLRARLADVWHVLAIIYVLAVYAVWTLEVPGGFEFLARATVLTLLVLALARSVTGIIARLVDRGFRLNRELRERHPLLQERANLYLPVLHRIVNVVIGIFTALLLLEIWGATPFAWLTGPDGRLLVSKLTVIAFILLASLVLWELISGLVQSALKRHDGATTAQAARMKTLLPLLQNAVRVVLVVLGTLIVLSELGINIAPLLAGAGVVGLAIGFGAQTLVKDVITGVFILLEDTLSVGDVVGLGSHVGVVEKLTIRTIHLRDLEGNVHTLPFSDVTTVLNYGKEFAYSLIEMEVAYREDTDEVIGIMREVASDLQADDVYGGYIIGEFEVLGVDRFESSGVIIRGRFKTRPMMQWAVRREYNRRIKKAFDAHGIEIPFPHQTLYFGESKEGTAPPARILEVKAERRGKPAAASPRRKQAKDASQASTSSPPPSEVPEVENEPDPDVEGGSERS